MLLLALLVFLVTWTALYGSVWLLGPAVHGLMPWLSSPWLGATLVFGGALLIAALLSYALRNFAPDLGAVVGPPLRPHGVQFFSWLLALLAGALLVTIASHSNPPPFVAGLVFPVAAVAILQAFGFDVPVPFGAERERAPASPAPEPTPAPPLEGDKLCRFEWTHDGTGHRIELAVRRSSYDNFRSRPRVSQGLWAEEYVARGQCGELYEVARQLAAYGRPFGTRDEVDLILSFVQGAIRYEREATEYPRYPLETLVDGCGDCEDAAILGAALLRIAGYDTALLFLPGHAALGVGGAENLPGTSVEQDGVRYYYCEMTSTGWSLGELPDPYSDRDIEVRPVPTLVISAS